MNKIFAVLLILLGSFQALSQKYSFVTYSTEEGLPQTQVTAISQDAEGYLWVGTLGGLAKFNGEKFETYSTNQGLVNNRITTLNFFENTLWIGHDGGISFIKDKKVDQIPFDGTDKSRKVSGIIRFREELFVCTNGGGLFKVIGNKLKNIPLGNADYDRVRGIYSYDDQMYLATRGGILTTRNGKDFQLSRDLDSNNYSGITGNEDVMVFATWSDGVYVKNLKTGKIKQYSSDKLEQTIKGCFVDMNNTIWLNAQEGIVRVSKEGEIDFLNEKNGLPVNMISCIFEDKDQNLWIGSQGKGLFRYTGEQFKFYDQSTGLPSDLFVCGFQKNDGSYFFGTFDMGVIQKDPDGTITRLNIDDYPIWAAIKNINNMDWFGTQSGLYSVDDRGDIKSYGFDDGLPGQKITAFYRIDNDKMYLGGSEGASYYDGNKFQRLGSEESRYIGTVRDFAVLDDSLYCVTNLGVFVLRTKNFEIVHNLNQVVYNLEKDNNDKLWCGTEEGLFSIDQGVIKRIDLLDDPASNIVNFLNFRNNMLFVGTNNGLFVLTDLDKDKPKVKRYGRGDGIIDLETNLNSGFFDNEGNFWFGTASGLICYHIDVGGIPASPPALILKSILLNYQPFDYNKYADELTPAGLPTKLVLPYSKNNLIFELDGISLVHHRGLRYQFLLEGMNEDWSPLVDISTITFTSLPAGEYNLKMRSVDLDGRMSEVVTFPFEIKPVYYKTWWFISLMVLITALIIWSFFKFRVRRINEMNEKEKLEYKTRLLALEQKSVNASMNRHFIFNALNSIQYFINTQDKLSANKYLTNFAQLIRKNLDAANANENTITLEEELSRIRLYLSLESMRFKDRFDYTIDVDKVDTEAILIPAMIMQPFVENSIIHGILPNESKMGHITIKIYQEGRELNILIEDNGIGVNQSLKGKTTMEGDHKSQGMEITSKRIELIEKISDNHIELIGPIEIVDENGLINGTRVLIKITTSYLEN